MEKTHTHTRMKTESRVQLLLVAQH